MSSSKGHNSKVNEEEEVQSSNKNDNKLAPFNPTNEHTLQVAMELFGFSQHDSKTNVLFDLGCGDGRFLIEAAIKHPTLRCVGIELDEKYVKRARAAIQELPPQVQRRIDIRHQDLCDLIMTIDGAANAQEDAKRDSETADETGDYEEQGQLCKELDLHQDATSIYLYLLPVGIQKIQPLLNQIVDRRKQEGRSIDVIACTFRIHAWEPASVTNTGKSGVIKTYHYHFPGEKAGD